jgi:hypothetical protein
LISVFLNPSSGKVNVKNSGIALYALIVKVVNGGMIISFDLEGATVDREFNLRSVWSPGMCFMTIYSENAFMVKKLIIK